MRAREHYREIHIKEVAELKERLARYLKKSKRSARSTAIAIGISEFCLKGFLSKDISITITTKNKVEAFLDNLDKAISDNA